MITLKEFWESEETLVIHCDTLEKAKKLCCAFDRMGKKWYSGEKYTSMLNWENYEEGTCYSNKGTHCDIQFYKRENVKVYEFVEIDDFNFKVGDRVRIREWQDMVNEYGTTTYGFIVNCGFTEHMKYLCGKEYTISRINNKNVALNDFDEDWSISTDMLEKIYDDNKCYKFREERYCKIVDKEHQYPAFQPFIDKFFSEYAKCFSNKSLYNGGIYQVIGKVKRGTTHNTIYLIKDLTKEEVYLIDKRGIKFVETTKGEEKKTMGLTKYSFRFNEERKSVTLYKNGEKVQFVKPQPNDKFSWKTGLGVCLYKQLYKGLLEIEYIKSITNEKVFYNYCIARFYGYDKSKVETLEEHVKDCKRKYHEFRLDNI